MALTITIGGAASDSYSTLSEFQAYATAQGWTLTATDAVQEGYLRRAAKYINQRYSWPGRRQYFEQAMKWPRVGKLYVDGWLVRIDTIPQQVKDAQCELAWIAHEGVDLMATVSGGAIKRKKVKAGPVDSETEYATTLATPRFIAVEGLLKPFIISANRMVRG